MNIRHIMLFLSVILTTVIYVGCGASSPSTPAQIPTSIEYATFEMDVGSTVDASASLSKAIEKAINVPCPASEHDPDAVCFTTDGFIVGFMKVSLIKCEDPETGEDVVCTTDNTPLNNLEVTNSDGSDPTSVSLWDATTTATEVYGDDVKSLPLDLSDETQSIPGTENITTAGIYSALFFKLAFIDLTLPTDASLGELSGQELMFCMVDGGCLVNGESISESRRGDIIKIVDNSPYWHSLTSELWYAARPDNPYQVNWLVEGDDDYDSYVFDPVDGAFSPKMKLDNDGNDTIDTIEVELGKTYRATSTFNLYATFTIKDNNPANDAYDTGEPFSPGAPTITFTAEEVAQ